MDMERQTLVSSTESKGFHGVYLQPPYHFHESASVNASSASQVAKRRSSGKVQFDIFTSNNLRGGNILPIEI